MEMDLDATTLDLLENSKDLEMVETLKYPEVWSDTTGITDYVQQMYVLEC